MKLLIFIILFTSLTFGQAGKSVLTQAQKDSIGGIISDSLNNPYSLRFSLSTPSTYREAFRFTPVNQYSTPWSLSFGETDFIAGLNGTDHVLNIGANWNGDDAVAQWGMQFEHNYERTMDSLKIYEWFIYYNDLPDGDLLSARPFFVGVYDDTLTTVVYPGDRFLTEVGINADRVMFSDEAYTPWMEFRSRSYSTIDMLSNNVIYIYDTTAIRYGLNNVPWLYQTTTLNGSKELMRIDDSDRISIAPDGSSFIFLASPLDSSIRWFNNAGAEYLSIQPDTNDVIVFDADGGIRAQSVKVNYLSDDTTDLGNGEFYYSPVTGTVQYSIPVNLIVNGDFNDWTAWGTFEWADDWHNNEPDTAHAYIENDGDAIRIHHDNTASVEIQAWNSALLEEGKTYGYYYEIVSGSSDSLVLFAGDVPTHSSWHSQPIGSYTGSVVALSTKSFNIVVRGTTDITIDNIKVWEIGGEKTAPTFDISKLLSGSDSFTTSATADTISNATITSSDVFIVSINDATPVADDLLSWTAETGRLIVHRPAGTTSNLAYSYMRIK